MMKNLLLVFVANLLLAFQGAYADDICSTATLTLNLKPKFPHGISVDYACSEDDTAKIQTILGPNIVSVLQGLGYTGVTTGDLTTVSCPSFDCETNAGDKCLPYCLPVEYCGKDTNALPVEHLGQLGQDQIDALRASLPACLGIKNQFMLDAHLTASST